MANLAKLPLIDEAQPTVDGGPAFRCVVEAPRGSAVKLKYDAALKAFVMGKSLPKGLTYPFDWGFLPSTLGDDGDPLDVLILHDCGTASGVVVPARIIGVLEAQQTEKGGKPRRNDRFLAVPVDSQREDDLTHVDQLPKRLRTELERFFEQTSALAGKQIELLGWRGPKAARALIGEGVKRSKSSS